MLREEAGRWREAVVLGEYCDALERLLVSWRRTGTNGPGIRSTLAGVGREYVRPIDLFGILKAC